MLKIYVDKKEVQRNNRKDEIILMLLELIVSAVTLMLASKIFKGFDIKNIWYALLTALLISVLNATIKPFLIWLTLPITIMTLGIAYPIVNLIILKLASALMGDAFVVTGWIVPFFVAIFISAITKILNEGVVRPFIEGR